MGGYLKRWHPIGDLQERSSSLAQIRQPRMVSHVFQLGSLFSLQFQALRGRIGNISFLVAS